MAFVLACICCLLQPVHSSLLWTPNAVVDLTSEWSKLEIAVAFGLMVGAIAMLVFALLLLPALIIGWTTALVFQFFLGNGSFQPNRLTHNGYVMALGIFRHAFLTILHEGKMFGFVAAVFIFLSFNKDA